MGQKATKDEYPTGAGGPCQKRGGSESQQKMNRHPTGAGGPCQKRGGSESQQKMNIQQEVGHVKKGRIRNVYWDPTRKI